ncbi:methyltransferase domain-containing protein [Nakamurella aerolata]|uniref:Trans-aconitate 2-methyltransferase n=1 Tax=Nakamurella aerolata TaxID=1656892 RepID=A0A849A3Z3_9ACTN|nr:methyltransferase domain-containing protein [Nakamurella aerolata]
MPASDPAPAPDPAPASAPAPAPASASAPAAAGGPTGAAAQPADDGQRAHWDPAQYGRFADHRSRPFFDLVDRIRVAAPSRVVDLGCGSGELTATLAQRWPDATVTGIDSSAEMLEQAAGYAGPRLRFQLGDLVDYRPEPGTDVVVSNAAYQWVPGHDRILAEIADAIPAGGALAVQVPGNFSAPSHRIIGELVAEPRWQQATGGLRLRQDPVLEPEGYVRLLAGAGLSPDVWETSYQQVLAGPDAVLEWVKGTALRPVLEALRGNESGSGEPGAQQAEFLAELAPRLRAAYPERDFGTVFAFRRIFLVGHRD